MSVLVRGLYSLGMWAAQPLLRRKLARRGVQEPGYLEAIEERFGHYGAGTPASSGWVWVHAVSMGETRAAAILVRALRRQMPGMRLLLTHGTATGRAEGKALLQPGDMQVWQPWDTPGAVRRFLAQFQPAIGILMETEVWPNMVAVCQQQGVPLVLANARLNAHSLRKAERVAWLARPAFGGLAAVWAQSQADADRLRQLGAPVQVEHEVLLAPCMLVPVNFWWLPCWPVEVRFGWLHHGAAARSGTGRRALCRGIKQPPSDGSLHGYD